MITEPGANENGSPRIKLFCSCAFTFRLCAAAAIAAAVCEPAAIAFAISPLHALLLILLLRPQGLFGARLA